MGRIAGNRARGRGDGAVGVDGYRIARAWRNTENAGRIWRDVDGHRSRSARGSGDHNRDRTRGARGQRVPRYLCVDLSARHEIQTSQDSVEGYGGPVESGGKRNGVSRRNVVAKPLPKMETSEPGATACPLVNVAPSITPPAAICGTWANTDPNTALKMIASWTLRIESPLSLALDCAVWNRGTLPAAARK